DAGSRPPISARTAASQSSRVAWRAGSAGITRSHAAPVLAADAVERRRHAAERASLGAMHQRVEHVRAAHRVVLQAAQRRLGLRAARAREGLDRLDLRALLLVGRAA